MVKGNLVGQQYTLSDIASQFGGHIVGDGTISITRVSSLNHAKTRRYLLY